MPTFVKDPDAVLDYEVHWASWLDADTIDTSEWVDVDDGITVDSDSHTTATATVWLSGGTVGASYRLTNRITTADGRTDDRTITVVIREK
jgi:hypothetical protein